MATTLPRVGAAMPPEGEDNLKSQACVGYKRNGFRPIL